MQNKIPDDQQTKNVKFELDKVFDNAEQELRDLLTQAKDLSKQNSRNRE